MRDECQHGQLRRQCELCDKDRRIAELEAALRPFARYLVKTDSEHVTVVLSVADLRETRRVLGLAE